MSHETALIEMQMWAWEEKFLYLAACFALLGFIGFLFRRAK